MSFNEKPDKHGIILECSCGWEGKPLDLERDKIDSEAGETFAVCCPNCKASRSQLRQMRRSSSLV